MKRLIYQVCLGEQYKSKLYSHCIQSVADYCFRQDRAIIPEGDTVVEIDDDVFFIAAKENIKAVMSELRKVDKPYKRIHCSVLAEDAIKTAIDNYRGKK